MTREEIVTSLRKHADQSVGNEWGSSIIGLDDNLSAAADLIENQQRHIARRDKQIEDLNQGMAQLAKDVAVKEEQSELHSMKNKLCQYCGKYKQAHEGSCDGCRWREM